MEAFALCVPLISKDDLMEERSIYFFILVAVLVLAVLQSLTIGGLFFFKSTGEKRANALYGILLITIGLTLLHNIFELTHVYQKHPWLNFLPIYFTLAFPALIFYYVKLNLYPKYRFKGSDLKHFILPVGQFAFFSLIFMFAFQQKDDFHRYFYNPFYGAFEQFLYLVLFFSYLYFSRRYIQQKVKRIRSEKEVKQIRYLSKFVKILFLLFCIHAVFVTLDFVSYEFLGVDLRLNKIYAGFAIFSFASIVFWLGTYGFQVLFWGRKVF